MSSRDPQSLAAAVLVACLSLVALARSHPDRARVTSPVASMPRREPPSLEHTGAGAQAARLREGRRLDLNRASEAELQLLPRIGPALAARIVARRQQAGPFARVSAVTAVSGIGPATLAALQPLVCIGGSASPPDERCRDTSAP